MSTVAPPYSYTRPQLGMADVALLLWRAKWIMALVFVPIFAVGMYVAFSLPREYVANSRVLISLSEEYLFRPRVGDGVQTQLPDTEQLIQSEIELLRSPVISDRVLEKLGVGAIYPKLAQELRVASEEERYELSEAAVTKIERNFSALAAPKTAVIQASFTHPDAATSAHVLNAILDTYIDYRSEIFEDKSPASLERQRLQFEQELRDVDEELRLFLQGSKITDFETERATTQALFGNVEQAILTNNSTKGELAAQLTSLEAQLASTPENIDIFVEDSSSQSLVALELEREELLARYRPDAQVVQDIEARIARAKGYLDGRDAAAGTVRRGPNPVYQEILTAYNTTRSALAASRQQGRELAQQATQIAERQMKLATIYPRWQELERKRQLLEENARNFATREVEARTLAEIADQGSDNIRILERARRPVKGSSLKLAAAIGSLLFACFCALIAGMLWVLTRRGFATPASLERTTGLPVVSTVRRFKS